MRSLNLFMTQPIPTLASFPHFMPFEIKTSSLFPRGGDVNIDHDQVTLLERGLDNQSIKAPIRFLDVYLTLQFITTSRSDNASSAF